VGVTPLLNTIEEGTPKALVQITTTCWFVEYVKLEIILLEASPGTPPLNAWVPIPGGGYAATTEDVSTADMAPESDAVIPVV
jgi:hypothetical protein